ncbi:hypothetical protein HH308_17000 [Gordonia sp. TBRC 11910]|uniref:Uncharacterized protein n=1 Tax=Gordonia asplenii TaxID=2725283 RepID=A0A848L2T1_9ACTN|nr:hypothetical protein [Gordonia asplenii]NMO02913.1 hypothetical protein [Gordonia asplenii]
MRHRPTPYTAIATAKSTTPVLAAATTREIAWIPKPTATAHRLPRCTAITSASTDPPAAVTHANSSSIAMAPSVSPTRSLIAGSAVTTIA